MVISFYNDICALTAIAIRGLNIPLIYSERNDPNKVNQRAVDKLYRKIIEHKADKFVFQTEGAKKCYPEKVQRKSCVILNPMDTSSFPMHDFVNEEKTIVSPNDALRRLMLLHSTLLPVGQCQSHSQTIPPQYTALPEN